MTLHVLNNQVLAIVLGAMQDGGLPHAGCRCPRCAVAFTNPRRGGLAACLAIVDTRPARPAVWLIDATPDIKWQLDLLAPLLGTQPGRPDRLRQPDGLFLTHAHMGHIAGLPQLGPEVMAVTRLPVYASAGLAALLTETALWRPLVDRLALQSLAPGQSLALAPGLAITPYPVPHRDEWGSGTWAFEVAGPSRRLLYVPDIDDWSLWPAAVELLTAVDVALVDGSFFSRDELGGLPPGQRPAHPLVRETIEFCAGRPGRLVLTHFNHTNPVLDAGSEARVAVVAAGVELAEIGAQYRLD